MFSKRMKRPEREEDVAGDLRRQLQPARSESEHEEPDRVRRDGAQPVEERAHAFVVGLETIGALHAISPPREHPSHDPNKNGRRNHQRDCLREADTSSGEESGRNAREPRRVNAAAAIGEVAFDAAEREDCDDEDQHEQHRDVAQNRGEQRAVFLRARGSREPPEGCADQQA